MTQPAAELPSLPTVLTSDATTAIVELAVSLSEARAKSNIREVQRISTLLDERCRPLRGQVLAVRPTSATRVLLASGTIEITADDDDIIFRVEESASRDAAVRLTSAAVTTLRSELLRVHLSLPEPEGTTPR